MSVGEEIGDALHIILRLSKRRDLAVLRDDAGAGVVAGERASFRSIAVLGPSAILTASPRVSFRSGLIIRWSRRADAGSRHAPP